MQLPPLEGAASSPASTRAGQHARWYAKNQGHLQRTFKRARLYLYDIVEAVEREGVPLEIALLPAVESAFQPQARSVAAADGLWQFIAPTGRRFDLKQHMFVDERRHIRAATQAALRYLKELNTRFEGDWQLALAAYNCGEGCIEKAVRAARARGLAGRFEDLRLNLETANYVPRLLALAQVVADPAAYSVTLPELRNTPYFAAVPITRDIDVDRAAELAGISVTDFRALNPQHKLPVIAAAANVEIYVPVEREQAFIEAMRMYPGPLSRWLVAKVLKRTSIEALAKVHRVDAQVLRAVNGVSRGKLVQGGSTVLVPRRDVGAETTNIPDHVVQTARLTTTPTFVQRHVRLRKGDTWERLAKRLQVAEPSLRQWNPRLALRRGTVAVRLPIEVAERLGGSAKLRKETRVKKAG
jgi:membrane-bound lytic murein transglycosylase D